jgi:hypothetical protein
MIGSKGSRREPAPSPRRSDWEAREGCWRDLRAGIRPGSPGRRGLASGARLRLVPDWRNHFSEPTKSFPRATKASGNLFSL